MIGGGGWEVNLAIPVMECTRRVLLTGTPLTCQLCSNASASYLLSPEWLQRTGSAHWRRRCWRCWRWRCWRCCGGVLGGDQRCGRLQVGDAMPPIFWPKSKHSSREPKILPSCICYLPADHVHHPTALRPARLDVRELVRFGRPTHLTRVTQLAQRPTYAAETPCEHVC